MFELAQALDMTLADLQRHFDGKDAIAEAWFDRADQTLLAIANAPGWMLQTPRQRLERAMFAWLDALAEHRRLTGAMLRYKLQPDHLHLQALGLMRISRTVQWIREVAGLSNAGWRRQLEEAALTSIYLTTFATWLRDDSPGAARAHTHLDRVLAVAERAAMRLGPTSDRHPSRSRDAQPVDSGYGEPLDRYDSAPG
jgi:AcrR family transcriptional regulator